MSKYLHLCTNDQAEQIKPVAGMVHTARMSHRAAMPSRRTAARLCRAELSCFPVNLSHSTWITLDCRLLPPLKNSCTCRDRELGQHAHTDTCTQHWE